MQKLVAEIQPVDTLSSEIKINSKLVEVKDHARLVNLDFNNSGHTGFASTENLEELHNDINQDITYTENNLAAEIYRAINEESAIKHSLALEIDRAINSENNITDNLDAEISRSTLTDQTLEDTKVNRSGDVITGGLRISGTITEQETNIGLLVDNNVVFKGNVDIKGTSTIHNMTAIDMAGKYIFANGDGADIYSNAATFEDNSGLVIKIDKGNAYGIVYSNIKEDSDAEEGIDAVILGSGKLLFNNATADTKHALLIVSDEKTDIEINEIKLGQVTIEDGQQAPIIGSYVIPSGNFRLNPHESNPVATRALSSDLIDAQHLRWDPINNKLVGSNLIDNDSNGVKVIGLTSDNDSNDTLTSKSYVDAHDTAENNRALARENQIEDNLNNEINRATEAENVITDTFNSQILRLDSSDLQISNKLNKEITDRENACESINTDIQSESARLTQEISNRTDADNILTNKINQEISDRTDADDALTTLINTKIAEINTKIADEIADEIAVRESADNTLTQKITDTNNNLRDEINSRTAADSAINGKIDVEISERKAADLDLNNQIIANKEAINQELVNRKNADDALDAKITTTTTNLTSEIQARIDADTTLTNSINNISADLTEETTARTNADNGLNNKLSALSNSFDIHRHDNATQINDGFMSAIDKKALDTIKDLLGSESGDSDTVVNKIREVLSVFENYPEATRIIDTLNNKVDKVTGKQLSTNDFTNSYKNNVDQLLADVIDIRSKLATVTITW